MAIQGTGPRQVTGHQFRDSNLFNDSTWKTVACLAATAFITIASFFFLAVEGCFLITLSALTITWVAFSQAIIVKARRLLHRAEKMINQNLEGNLPIEGLSTVIQPLQEILTYSFQDDVFRAKLLNNLAYILTKRDQNRDIERRLQLYEQALALPFQSNYLRAEILNNFALALRIRNQNGDLERAIHLTEQALALSFRDDLFRAEILNNFALIFRIRSQNGDLERRVQLYEQALALPFRDDRFRAIILDRLASNLEERDQDGDLERAIQFYGQAVGLADDFFQARFLEHLNRALERHQNRD